MLSRLEILPWSRSTASERVMIKTKEDLAYYLEADRKAQHRGSEKGVRVCINRWLFPDYKYEWHQTLRRFEYWANQPGHGFWTRLMRFYYRRRFIRLRALTGIDCGINVIGPGTWFNHGKVLVSDFAKIGANCKILSDVTIGGQGRYDKAKAATVGDRVFIGSGARLIGDITIADDCVIGANAVVLSSFTEPGVTIAGAPARKVSNEGSYYYLNKA